MKTYLVKFQTNYEESAIIITTDKGMQYAKERALYLGAWDGCDIEEVNTVEEGIYCSVNFGAFYGKLNKDGLCPTA
jgi:hypothetical protein